MSVSRRTQAAKHLARLEALRPADAAQLRRFVSVMLSMDVPDRAVVQGHDAPMAYLSAAFFGDGWASDGATRGEAETDRAGDLVVWACRGGGKTMLGAVATLLDLLFKPGIQVRILGGSLEQSGRMYRYLRQMVDRPALRGALMVEPTQRRIELANGSAVEVLAQSQRSVRGTRVHKLRCDEVEEFRPEVWQAAQLVTRSGLCGQWWVRGGVEALSTMHRPFGLMNELVGAESAELSQAHHESNATAATTITAATKRCRVIRWSALDVIEKCPPERDCKACVLWKDCQGRAKEASGFVKVDDLVSQWHRCSATTWESEMLCKRPRVDDSVYPGFDLQRHVVNASHDEVIAAGHKHGALLVAGCDFGIRSPLVWLWAKVTTTGDDVHSKEANATSAAQSNLEIIAEHSGSGVTFERHMQAIEASALGRVAWVGVDPAGGQRNDQTGLSNIDVLRRRGYRVRATRVATEAGIEAVRRRLDRGTLRVSSRCTGLLRAMREYHFDIKRSQRDEPVKDGPDHWCDALRYLVQNLDGLGSAVTTRKY
jgi:hypothetical protein